MVEHIDIRKAIGNHGLWKSRLKEAIERGTSEFKVAEVAEPDRCEFGKWLHGLDAARNPAALGRLDRIRSLHKAFHGEVAKVLSQALSGKKDQALKAMELGTPFSKYSLELTCEMADWAKNG